MNRTRPVPSRRLSAPPSLVLALGLALAVLSPASGYADYKDTYLEGLKAVEAQNWGAAARAMQEAVAEEPRESERIRFYGMRFDSYVPHYYLGVARSQLGDCEGALRAFEVSTGQGVIQNLGEYGTLQQLRGGCEERLAETAVEDVQVVEEQPESRPVPPPAKPAPARPDPVPVIPSEEAPSRPVEQAEAAVGEARGEEIREDKAELARLEAERKAEEVRERQAELARLEAEREAEEERRRGELRDRIAAAAEAGETPTGPPEALRAAARAYFNGDYRGVLGALSGQELEDEAVAAQALLFRAAARYALYLLGGEEEETLAEEAREEVAFCRRLAPDLAPDPAAFSPRFVAFFAQED